MPTPSKQGWENECGAAKVIDNRRSATPSGSPYPPVGGANAARSRRRLFHSIIIV